MVVRRGGARSEQGASAVEFALVMIPMITLLFGAIQYGLYFWAYQGGSDIARDAARLAAVSDPSDCASFQADIKDQIDSLSGSGADAVVKRTYERTDPAEVRPGDRVTVTVQFKSVDLNFPFVPFINDGLVTSQARGRVDYTPSQPQDC
jgi:Flp pilus assembly protein TadG